MLFIKECKKTICSLTFLMYIAAFVMMYATQFHADLESQVQPPEEGAESYGMTVREEPDTLMPAAADGLVMEYLNGVYTAYPIGFIKEVKLTEKKKAEMAEVIEELTGLTKEELDGFTDFDEGGHDAAEDADGEVSFSYHEPVLPSIQIPKTLTYERFRELMQKADDLIGGGSRYGEQYLVYEFSRVPRTYEEAREEYDAFIDTDRITGGYARLYCDYMGILLGILPVFVAASLCGRDKRAHMEALIYTRKASSARIIFARFAALVFCMAIPVVLTAAEATVRLKLLYPQNAIDLLGMAKYAAAWLLPNIMLSSAVGMAFTELLSPLLGILIQGSWWFININLSAGALTGNITKYTMVMRHNSLYGTALFHAELGNVVYNRIFYTLLSLALILLTVFIYEKKRRGNYLAFGMFRKNSKRKPAA